MVVVLLLLLMLLLLLLLLLLLFVELPGTWTARGGEWADRRRAVNRANRAICIFFILPNRGVLPA